MQRETVRAVDLFCGAGGTSTGLARACEQLGVEVELTAINHWDVAIETHTLNHPWATHLNEPIEAVDPRVVVPGGHLDLLVASPECTHFSTARGGKPVNDQKRSSPWMVLRWLDLLQVDSVLIENVPEFRSWGPVNDEGRVIKEHKGETFAAFLAAIRSMGYTVDHRVLNAADHGEATSRRRLFIVARRNAAGLPVRWPRPRFSADGSDAGTEQWRGAREVIDWSLPGKSIFQRRRPLAERTIERIARGLERHGGPHMRPFAEALRRWRPGEGPVEVELDGELPSELPGFVLPQHSGGVERDVAEPLPTIATGGAIGLAEPFILTPFGERDGQALRTHDIESPLPTVTSAGAGSLVDPYLVRYHGNGSSHAVDEPVPTITTKDRYGLVVPELDGAMLDIRYRMLQPHELARAMGFGDEYEFAGSKTEKVKQIGNAVAVNLAKALCLSLFGHRASATLFDHAGHPAVAEATA